MSLPEKIKKWQGAILSASIILNVFLIGFMAARVLIPQQQSASRSQPVQFEFRSLPESLSGEAREEIEEQMRMHQEHVSEAYERLREVQEEINVMVSEQDFDADALEQSLREMRQLEQEIRGPMQRAFVNVMRNADHESRRAIVNERRNEMRQRMRNKVREPNRVDGSRWSFSTDDGHIQLEMDGIKNEEMLKGLRGLEELEHLAPHTTIDVLDNLEGLDILNNLDELSDLENFEIIITRDKDEDGKDSVRFIVIDKDTEEVVIEGEGDEN